MSESISIAGFGPLSIRRPTTIAELCRLVSEARASSQSVYPMGGRTMLDVGFPPTKPGFAVDTTLLAEVVDYPARDMTITVQAGITIAKLQETLAKENQWLPVDVPLPSHATLGGAIATNCSGPHRFGYGTLRDYVIGIHFVTDDGVEVKGGGRVVKNVAGYDFMKLQTGALGTLGILSQVTLKVKPRSETAVAIVFGCPSSDLSAVLDLLHKSNSRPVAVELLNQHAWRATGQRPQNIVGDWILVVGFEEKAVTVEWQRSTLLKEIPAKDATERSGQETSSLWQSLTDLQIHPESKIISKATVKPSRVAEMLLSANREGVALHAQPLNGILWQHSTVTPATEWSIRRGGTSPAKNSPERELMKHIKKTLDPNDVFNPGRLLG